MKTAVYPGSFDPLTLGHMDIIKRASLMFDNLIVLVSNNITKSPLFLAEERVKMIEEAVRDFGNVKVDSFSGLLSNYTAEHDIHIAVRGLRAVPDFEYELQIAQTNYMLSKGSLDTVYLTTSLEYAHISSSGVKEIAFFDGDITGCVPESVAKRIHEKYVTINKKD